LKQFPRLDIPQLHGEICTGTGNLGTIRGYRLHPKTAFQNEREKSVRDSLALVPNLFDLLKTQFTPQISNAKLREKTPHYFSE
jgi:hypothetical protein